MTSTPDLAWRATTQVTGGGSLSGRVTDATDDSPIAWATVEAAGTLGGGPFSATTDKSGEYTLSDLSPDDYNVTAAAEGYESRSQPVLVVTGIPPSTSSWSRSSTPWRWSCKERVTGR